MISILEYYDSVNSVCSFWRGRGVLAELEREGKCKLTLSNWDENWSEIRRHDIAFFQRPMSAFCVEQVEMCRDLGLYVWLDFDDYYLVPEDHEMYSAYKELFDLETFRKTLLLANIITVTNNEMLLSYAMFEPRIKDKIEIIPNALNDKVFSFNDVSTEKRIVWRGGSNHVQDILPFIDDIQDVLNEHEDWWFGALGYDLELDCKNYQYVGDLPIHHYFGFMKQAKPSVVIAPLDMCKFNKCKSNIVWQEATMAGAVTISPIWSDFQIGFRYGDFKTEFENAIKHSELREKYHKDSLNFIKQNLVLSKVNEKRLKIINDARGI